MIHTDKIVVVEGKYDEIKLSGIIDATIIRTDGFGIFKDKEKQGLLQRLASARGLIILTDSDSAGFMIRNFLGNKVPEDKITNVYIPDLYGKEKRKTKPSAEGKLGVEGIPADIIREAFRRAGIPIDETDGVTSDGVTSSSEKASCNEESKIGQAKRQITNLDFYEDGITGGANSKAKRVKLQKALQLPERLSATSLLKIINILIDYDEYKSIVDGLD